MNTGKFLARLALVAAFTGANATLSFAQIANGQPAYPPPAGSQRFTPPGTLNYLEGQVQLNSEPLLAGQSTLKAMQPGDTLSTSANGYAEVLLTPGAFLRIGPNSEIRLNTAGLASAQVALNRGASIVEIDSLLTGTNLAVTVNSPAGANVTFDKKGLYDLNADRQTVSVLDGKATVSLLNGNQKNKNLTKGDELLLNSLKVHELNAKAEKAQALYVWSEARANTESQANLAVAQNIVAYGGWYGPGWYWNPYGNLYSFLPGDGFLYSPFGWGFYSPSFIGYYGVPWGYARWGAVRPSLWHGRVGGVNAHVSGLRGSGFHGGGHR